MSARPGKVDLKCKASLGKLKGVRFFKIKRQRFTSCCTLSVCVRFPVASVAARYPVVDIDFYPTRVVS